MTITIVGGGNPSGPTFPVQRSVRLRSSASAYFNRTFTTPTSPYKWTLNLWVKRGALSTDQEIFSHVSSAQEGQIFFTSANVLRLYEQGTANGDLSTVQVFRDSSAWGMLTIAVDTTQATATNRVLVYWNNVACTLTGTSWALNSDGFNKAIAHTLGRYAVSSANPFDGYMTEVNFIDGQALTPTSFGAYNSYGVWSPAKYTGSYGNNGFYLNFQDNSAATAAAIGKDSSGNGNNWTPNNISVTAGVTYDSMLDVPTLTNANNANFCVLNPLAASTSTVPAQGNLYLGTNGSNNFGCVATFGVSSGKWYWEVKPDSSYVGIGITSLSFLPANSWPGSIGSQAKAYYSINGQKFDNGTNSAYGATFSSADLIGVALDMDAGTITFYKNNVSQGVAFTSLTGIYLPVIGSPNAYNSGYINFGQRPFSYTPPTGFVALNTYNLATPVIPNGATQFAAKTYSGTASVQQYITVGFQPDLVWMKSRSDAYNNYLTAVYDSFNGSLISNSTAAETGNVLGNPRVDSNGIYPSYFEVGGGSGGSTVGKTFVAWTWKANGTPSVINTSGSIPSTISANTTAGFSIVTYTGVGSTGTIGHGLGIAPKFIITKYRNAVNAWLCYHSSLGAGNRIYLNQTDAAGASATVWNNTSPTSSVFSVGDANTNASGGTFVAYCWAEIPGFSKFGSYTGNGSADGPFVYLGFRPRYVMIKSSSLAGSDWAIWDTSRDPYNIVNRQLVANGTNTDTAATADADILSNGFKPRRSATNFNSSGATYIYMAFAENPFNYSLAR
jgi:hypothetical protein